MAASISDERAVRPSGPGSDLVTRLLGHPAAYVATLVLLLALFAWPFIGDASRVAPTKDPAYYTWRTEALITETPLTLLGIEGPNEMFAAGYRVAAPVIGGLLRHVGDIGSLSVTIFLMVGLPVAIALLLAGFARRLLPDPLIWHAVAFTSAGLLLTPPFVGYLDNVLCLFFLAAGLYFLRAENWPTRFCLFMLLLLAGFTHPTTLVIFCAVLGMMSAARLIVDRFDLRAVIRSDGWMLATGAAAAVTTFLIWTIGLWGRSVPLTEAALPPPYSSEFFVDRMMLWIGAMRPALNGPLFLLGAAMLVARGTGTWRDHKASISLVWLAPLLGCLGFLAGLAYPYYRFFNTTLAWVLLAGLGAGIALRFFVTRGSRQPVFFLGALAVIAVLGTNLTHGFEISGWTKVKNQWLAPQARADLDELRDAIALENRDRPIVFVVDDEPSDPRQIYGFTKLSGNTSRYALPAGQIDRGYLYLGSIENLLRGEPTETGDSTYDKLSRDFLTDTEEGIEKAGLPPVIVLAEAFNPAGSNAAVAAGEDELDPILLRSNGDAPVVRTRPEGTHVWTLHDGAVSDQTPDGPVGLERSGLPEEPPGLIVHLGRVLLGLCVLIVPGILLLPRVLREATLADRLGLVPALSLALTSIVGVIVLAVVQAPFSVSVAWMTALASVVVAFIVGIGPRRQAT